MSLLPNCRLKNELIFNTVKKYAPEGASVINFGCTLEEQEKYSYIDVSVLVGILIESGAVDFINKHDTSFAR